MSTTYLLFKVLHVVAAVVLVGTSVAMGFWKAWADKTGDAKTIAHTLDGLLQSSRRFIMPSSLMLIVAGFVMTGMGHIPLGQKWLVGSIVLLVVATVAGMAGLAPTTRAARALVDEAARSGGAFDRERYAALSARWKTWHLVTMFSGVLAVALMVLRPQ